MSVSGCRWSVGNANGSREPCRRSAARDLGPASPRHRVSASTPNRPGGTVGTKRNSFSGVPCSTLGVSLVFALPVTSTSALSTHHSAPLSMPQMSQLGRIDAQPVTLPQATLIQQLATETHPRACRSCGVGRQRHKSRFCWYLCMLMPQNVPESPAFRGCGICHIVA